MARKPGKDGKLHKALRRDPGAAIKATLKSQPQPEPIFDEKDFVDGVREIIGKLKQPFPRAHRPRRGVDLSKHEETLCKLAAEISEWYIAARDDWDARSDKKPYDPFREVGKPLRDLEMNPYYQAQQLTSDAAAFDYGGDEGAGFSETFEEFWDRHYARPEGAPKYSLNVMPNEPLDFAYVLLRDFWRGVLKKKSWRPTYDIAKNRENAEGRLFLLFAQKFCDARYQKHNCQAVYQRLNMSPKKKARRAERQRERRSEKSARKAPN